VIGETFISYKRFRWLWITIAFLVLSLIVYIVDAPPGGRNGGTIVGYTLGVVSALVVVWLMAYGLRKRSYHSTLGTVEGWLAAHVWIGIGLLLLVPLHAGFSFGANVHTLAYAAMVATILSGIWGVANYGVLSAQITAHRGGSKDESVLEQIYELSEKIVQLSVGKSNQFLVLLRKYDFQLAPSLKRIIWPQEIPFVDPTIAGAMLREVPQAEREDAISLVGLLDRRADLARGLLEQTRIKALLKIWLFVHVPASVVLCVSLAVHILSVFFFW
jgi:hypothetical protein